MPPVHRTGGILHEARFRAHVQSEILHEPAFGARCIRGIPHEARFRVCTMAEILHESRFRTFHLPLCTFLRLVEDLAGPGGGYMRQNPRSRIALSCTSLRESSTSPYFVHRVGRFVQKTPSWRISRAFSPGNPPRTRISCSCSAGNPPRTRISCPYAAGSPPREAISYTRAAGNPPRGTFSHMTALGDPSRDLITLLSRPDSPQEGASCFCACVGRLAWVYSSA